MKYSIVLLIVTGVICAVASSDPSSTYSVNLSIKPTTFGLGTLLRGPISSAVQLVHKILNAWLYTKISPNESFPVENLLFRWRTLQVPTFERVLRLAFDNANSDMDSVFKVVPILFSSVSVDTYELVKVFKSKIPKNARSVKFLVQIEAAEAYFGPFLTQYIVSLLNGHE